MSSNIIKFHKAGSEEKLAECAASVLETAKNNLEVIKNKKFGRITFIATLMLDDRGNVVTQYNGDIRSFSTIGGLQYMAQRIFNENLSDEDD